MTSAENWTGDGFLRCYGGFDIIESRPWNDVTGTAQCRPTQWDGASDPQAIFIEGTDGTELSIFVWNREEVTADCVGEISYTYGNLGDLNYCSNKSDKSMAHLGEEISLNPRTQCGYFQCSGFITLECERTCFGIKK